jgi:hypothetical protein
MKTRNFFFFLIFFCAPAFALPTDQREGVLETPACDRISCAYAEASANPDEVPAAIATIPPAPSAAPKPVLVSTSESEPSPGSGPDREGAPSASNFDRWLIDIEHLPSVGGVPVAVKSYPLAAWDEPFTRTPGAPDYDALCPGPWQEIHYRSNQDMRQRHKRAQNVRIYIHALKDAAGNIVPYTSSTQSRARCTEFIGVPDQGRKPQVKGRFSARYAIGLIIRGFVVAEVGKDCGLGQGIDYSKKGNQQYVVFSIMHDNEFYGCGGHTHFLGGSRRHWPRTYVEMIGNVSAYARQSHTFYIENSVGRLIYKGNVCFAPGWGHCFKNLAHSSLIEGNVFSNAGLQGEVVTLDNSPMRRNHKGGMHPLDLYGCTDTEVLDNTIIYRTTANIRTIIAYRPRGSWGGCNKGRQLDQSTWEYMHIERDVNPGAERPPAVVRDYFDPAFWQAVRADLPLFDQGYDAALASDLLFAHRVAGNKFIVIPAHKGRTDVNLARMQSLRPVTKKGSLHESLAAEAAELAASCAGDAACYLTGASLELRYAYDHLRVSWQSDMPRDGKIPAKAPMLPPEGWVERYAVYWQAEQEAYMCKPDGTNCAPWDAPLPSVPAGGDGPDDVVNASPPRVIYERD